MKSIKSKDWKLNRNYKSRCNGAAVGAIAEVYGFADSGDKFIQNLVAAWTKLMNLVRFDFE